MVCHTQRWGHIPTFVLARMPSLESHTNEHPPKIERKIQRSKGWSVAFHVWPFLRWILHTTALTVTYRWDTSCYGAFVTYSIFLTLTKAWWLPSDNPRTVNPKLCQSMINSALFIHKREVIQNSVEHSTTPSYRRKRQTIQTTSTNQSQLSPQTESFTSLSLTCWDGWRVLN